MGTKMAVSFANNFMAETGTKLILQSETKPREWRRYIDDVFSLWDCDRKEVDRFIKRVYFHLTIKFTAEISENQITFLDNRLFKGERFGSHLGLQNPLQAVTENFASCHPSRVKYGFIKGEAIGLSRTNSSKETFKEGLLKFKQRLKARGYPENIIERSLSGVNFAFR